MSMNLRRKSKQDAAWEGWNTRQACLGEFLPLSPEVSSSQYSAIEWSSSDEENDQDRHETSKITSVPGIRAIHLSKKKPQSSAFPNKLEWRAEPTKGNSLKEKSEANELYHAKSSDPRLPSDSPILKRSHIANVNKFPSLTNQNKNSDSISLSISDSHQYNRDFNSDTNFHTASLKTPEKAKDDNTLCSDTNLISPIIGSQRSTAKGHILRTSINDNSNIITEQCSPVLRSQNIVKRRMVLSKRHLVKKKIFDFAPKETKGDNVIPELCRNQTGNEVHTPAAEINKNEDPVQSKIKRRNLSHAFSWLEHKKPKSNEENKDNIKLDHIPKQASCVYTEPQKINTDSCLMKKRMYIDKEVTYHCLKIGNDEERDWHLRNNSQNQKASRFSALKESLLQDEEDTCGDDVDIEQSSSQNSILRSEVADSQSDVGIDSIASPWKQVSDNSDKSSLASYDAAISVESAPSSAPATMAQDEKLVTGSHWIRTLQQHTPEKPSRGGATEGGMESAKKRAKKDGHGERLRRLILSWQSSVHMWAHQVSLTNAHCQYTEILKDKFQTRQAKSVFHTSYAGVTVKKEILMDSSSKSLLSPAIKNLQNALIESPVSSPAASGLASIQHHLQMPKRYLEVRIVKVGGRLPSNAAVCELILRSPDMETNIKQENEKETCGYKEKYLVFFALQEQKVSITLHVNDVAKIFSPWHQLDLPSYSIPTLFTSYFIMHQNDLTRTTEQVLKDDSNLENHVKTGSANKTLTSFANKSRLKKKIILTTWACLCSRDETVLPSMCDVHQHAAHHPCVPQVTRTPTSSPVHPGFTIINDTPEETPLQNEAHPAWTILEAIEKCGGVSDVPVTITVRIHRIITHRKASDMIKEWELVGQDAAGVFCSFKIPNRPLACQLTELLERGEGCTHTLTQVTIHQRLTNTQNPALFSLISSLHKAYQTEICSDPLLYPLLQNQTSCPSQTYCYVFNVRLGLTELLHTGDEVVIPVSLPYWSLDGALQVLCDGQRGCLSLHILYKVDSFLYVVNKVIKTEDTRDSITTQDNMDQSKKREFHSKKEASKNDFEKQKFLVKKIMVGSGTVLPSWIPESGTVMQSALLRDVVIWNGNVMVDEYTLVQQQETCMKMSLSALHKILLPLSVQTQHHDLTLISGKILRVDEETAYTWPTCGECKSDNVQEMLNSTVDCLACGQKSTIPGTGYCLEVWLDCGLELKLVEVKVKLYQRSIEKLLSAISGLQEEYDAVTLVGHHIGPMVCVLLETRRARHTRGQTYTLTELPY
ncbi:DNA repair-scaffolding protein [Procambarus clarkii]|uniref:DNA repair-scaffolding protein n=1 Tax=Procambarus clarkii TaxID=6728 RepID=UPI0037431A86